MTRTHFKTGLKSCFAAASWVAQHRLRKLKLSLGRLRRLKLSLGGRQNPNYQGAINIELNNIISWPRPLRQAPQLDTVTMCRGPADANPWDRLMSMTHCPLGPGPIPAAESTSATGQGSARSDNLGLGWGPTARDAWPNGPWPSLASDSSS